MKVLFFGTPPFAAEVLETMISKGVEVVGVVTSPDKPVGRSGTPMPSAVKKVAERHCLSLHQPAKPSSKESAVTIEAFGADLFVVVAYGYILRNNLLEIPSMGCINIHGSILPKYRGAAPIQQAIIDGCEESGVTIMYMVREMDAGDIISIAKVPISENMTAGELSVDLCKAGSQALLDVLSDLDQGIVHRTPQNHEEATHAGKLDLSHSEIIWNAPAQELHNRARGTTPRPGAWCQVVHKEKSKRLKILRTTCENLPHHHSPGTILSYTKEGIVVACAEGALALHEVQIEGKKAMNAQQFVAGTPVEQLHFIII